MISALNYLLNLDDPEIEPYEGYFTIVVCDKPNKRGLMSLVRSCRVGNMPLGEASFRLALMLLDMGDMEPQKKLDVARRRVWEDVEPNRVDWWNIGRRRGNWTYASNYTRCAANGQQCRRCRENSRIRPHGPTVRLTRRHPVTNIMQSVPLAGFSIRRDRQKKAMMVLNHQWGGGWDKPTQQIALEILEKC